MPDLPAGTDRNRLVVVRPKDVPENTPVDEVPEHVVGAAWLQSAAGADDFEFVRFEGETEEQAAAREEAAAAAAAEAAAAQPKQTKQQAPAVDRFAQQ